MLLGADILDAYKFYGFEGLLSVSLSCLGGSCSLALRIGTLAAFYVFMDHIICDGMTLSDIDPLSLKISYQFWICDLP